MFDEEIFVEKNRRPRWTFIAAAAVSAVLALSGCSGQSGSASSDVELRFAWWGNADRAKITQQAIDRFEEKNPGITVLPEYTDFGSYFDRLATNVAGGDAPDVITLAGAYTREYAGRGALLDLSKVSEELDTSSFPEAVLGAGKIDGTQYGVPTGVNTLAVIVNPRVLSEAGVELPNDSTWSWQDYADVATTVADKSPEGIYGTTDMTNIDVLELFARQRGESMYTEDGKLNIQPGTLEAWWKMTGSLSKTGGAPSASTTIEIAGQGIEQSLMARGMVGMQLAWTNQFGAFRKAAGEELKMLQVPGESQKEHGLWLQAGQVYAIGGRSEHPAEAAKLIDFLLNDPEAAKFIKTDRGVPANSDVLQALQPELSELQKFETQFVDRMGDVAGAPLVIGPVGSTAAQSTLDRLNGDVLFERSTPARAADEFVREMSAAIQK